MRRTLAALGIVVAVLAGACGSGAATPTAAVSHAAVPGVGSVIPLDDGYETFEVYGAAGSTALGNLTTMNPAEIQQVLSANGKTADDFSYAIATGSKGSVVTALQIKGLSASYFSQLIPGANTDTMKHEKVGGKDVLASESAGTGQWLYMKDDMVFSLVGTKDGADPFFRSLP